MIRPIRPDDFQAIKAIHQKFYASEFSLEDFYRGLEGAVITDDTDNSIIAVGGTRPILEIVNMTNKDKDINEKRAALYKILQMTLFTAARLEFNQLHAFIQDEKWEKHLIRAGFKPTTGRALYINL